jgi:O-antigen ligase
MILAERWRDSRQFLVGAALGVYAALAALAPSRAGKIALSAPILLLPIVWPIVAIPNAWLAFFLACALLAPPLPIALGDTGPHVALLFAAAGLFAGLLRLREWRFTIDPILVSLVSLWAILLASVSMAAIYSGLSIAAASFARVLLFGISVYVFLYVRDGPGRMGERQSFRALRLLYWAATASALFACVDFYFQFPAPAGYEQQFIWLAAGRFRRAQGVFYEASTLGNLCAFFLEMIAVALFRPRQERPISRMAMLIGGAALAAALVLSYSRGSLINLGVALLALLWLHRERFRWRRLAVRFAVLSAGLAAAIAVAFPVFAGLYWLRIFTAFQYFLESPNAVLSGRVQSWQMLGAFLLSHPWHLLLGVGYKTLPYSTFIGQTAVADNTYLGLLAETGIAGLAAVLLLNIAILATAYRAFRSANAVRSFCGAWMFCFWMGQAVQMLSADLLTYWRVLPVYFFVLALAGRDESS